MTTNWRDRAACQGSDLSIFFPDVRGEVGMANAEATVFCDRCPVRRDCLEYELSKGGPQFGWFGGKSPAEREAIIRKRKRTGRAAA